MSVMYKVVEDEAPHAGQHPSSGSRLLRHQTRCAVAEDSLYAPRGPRLSPSPQPPNSLHFQFNNGRLNNYEQEGKNHLDKYRAVFPHEVRMRNLTYATELFVDIALSKKEFDRIEQEIDPKTGQRHKKVKHGDRKARAYLKP